ncbi:isoprenylcysteine carboxylmethyltransferase family protein [Neomegalonema sp.]|uniref:methyltransferase family protein n=1 Tax=Neomegalonema sp. TaxID=2039713 RepID=UPI002617E8EF|nr:isoprenylcysteine carboxylmethyltransferase family protein [Neomegalonema sp.]MDD2868917.1 isoprenylcysteine carboxylmethyltransferase family protein [Neomegalonema sp.]
MSIPLTRPASVVSQRIQIFAVGCFLATAVWLRGSDMESLPAAFLLCASYALPVALLERWRMRPHRSPSAGLDWDSPPRPANWGRIAVKLFGFWATLAIIALLYRLFPQYAAGMYKPFFAAVSALILPLAAVSPFYVWMLDGRMRQPEDGTWAFGALLLGRPGVDPEKIRQYALGWLVKGFFLPLMFSGLHDNLVGLRGRPPIENLDLLGLHFLIYDYLLLIDVGCIVVGYALTLRLIDSHIRSAEPTAQGWFWTLVCYPPFWNAVGPEYLAYRTESDWRLLFAGHPVLLGICSALILGLMGIYAWASVSFGLRFSNLTHRGIVTNGPYRYSRHPAYVSKNLSWWVETLPFLTPFLMGARYGVWRGYWLPAAARCLRLLGVNLIYAIRAWSEERHLSRDPVYVRYALWVERHGALSWLTRLFPILRYRPPEGWEPEPPPAGPEGADRARRAPDGLQPSEEASAESRADTIWLHEAARAEGRSGESARASGGASGEAPAREEAQEARRQGGGDPSA